MTRLVKCYNLRFKTCFQIFFEEITGIRSQVPAIFTENNEVIFRRFQLFYFFDLVLQMGANGASCQELQLAPNKKLRKAVFCVRNGSVTPREEGFTKQTQVMLLGGWCFIGADGSRIGADVKVVLAAPCIFFYG
jgi:hypothetical protein